MNDESAEVKIDPPSIDIAAWLRFLIRVKVGSKWKEWQVELDVQTLGVTYLGAASALGLQC